MAVTYFVAALFSLLIALIIPVVLVVLIVPVVAVVLVILVVSVVLIVLIIVVHNQNPFFIGLQV